MPKADTGQFTTASHIQNPAFWDAPALGCSLHIQEAVPLVPVLPHGLLDFSAYKGLELPHGESHGRVESSISVFLGSFIEKLRFRMAYNALS